ncbi:hypothetical protein PG996_002527 [Apiospora saccharicola]|uniref:NmrA-like domain-containing protein n=1 Tax=Apiospora saccharicola TaxID=335842 RepID=A0ABR1WJR2_9PEZI
METVLVVGATGNIGTSAITAALRSKRQVLAVVRNQKSGEKLFKNLGTSEGVTLVEADVVSETGLKGVVDQVRAGKLPAFQHVFTCVGADYIPVALKDITPAQLRDNMSRAFESNFYPTSSDRSNVVVAYRETIGYLLKQNQPATYTICTGAMGDLATWALPAMTQGPLFSMATAASRENAETNVRFNEIYLAMRVEVDEDAKQHGVTSATEFAPVYEAIMSRSEIRSSRVRIMAPEDIKDLKYERKF